MTLKPKTAPAQAPRVVVVAPVIVKTRAGNFLSGPETDRYLAESARTAKLSDFHTRLVNGDLLRTDAAGIAQELLSDLPPEQASTHHGSLGWALNKLADASTEGAPRVSALRALEDTTNNRDFWVGCILSSAQRAPSPTDIGPDHPSRGTPGTRAGHRSKWGA